MYLGGTIPYVEDPFNRKRELEKKERDEHHSKLQEKPFSNKVKGREVFFNNVQTYGEDRVYPPRTPPLKREPIMTHDVPFKPSNPPKRGYNKTLEKFPPYKEDPMRPVLRKKESPEGADDKPNFKPTYKKRSVPCPSVSTNYRNLKSEFPSIFRKL